ncbi:MAG: lipopolysaccharide heptosyltransferase II [Verrucomicrobia bacterium]|nr:lipopolysaccharide heptosyltransferase II [Verrucomicrobiota bacterium]
MKILILKPSALGDVVQALPVLRLIKLRYPGSEIYWWVNSNLSPLLEADPDLTGVISFERNGWAGPKRWKKLWQNVRWMRAQAFDWVIDLQGLARSGSLAWLANGKCTIGLDEPREGARGFYDIIVARPTFHTHAVDWYLRVLPFLEVPVHWNFNWLPERADVAVAVQQKWNPGSARWLIVQPGARWLNKRWPAEYFAELVRQLTAQHPELRFAILGAEEDRSLGTLIARAAPTRCLALAGELTLPEMVEWIRLSVLMVTNDTGPMHVAAALGKPVVPIFGPTEPRRTGPYRQTDQALQLNLPCVPCLKSTCTYEKPFECLRGLSPATVLAHVQQRLASPAN